MVKRKAEVSIDEWLGEGHTQSDNHRETPAAAENRLEPTATPVAPVVVNPVPVGPVVPVPADEVATVDEAAVWFWELLESCGYRRW